MAKTKKQYRKRLTTPNSIRQYLIELVHLVKEGSIEPQKASKIGYLLNIALSAMNLHHVQTVQTPAYERLDELERKK
jgi:hypothetical protein